MISSTVMLRKQVANIVKKNSKASMAALNMRMLDLIQADKDSKTVVMQRLMGCVNGS